MESEISHSELTKKDEQAFLEKFRMSQEEYDDLLQRLVQFERDGEPSGIIFGKPQQQCFR